MKQILFLILINAMLLSCSLEQSEERQTKRQTLKELKTANLKGLGLDVIIENYGVPNKIEDSLFVNDDFDRSSFDTKYHKQEFVSLTYWRNLSTSEQKKTGRKKDVVILTVQNKSFNTGTIPAFIVTSITKWD